ncbi:hypothetical protein ALC62_01895 [Cyphomyrmex costatus]|uniref:Transposable element P transposase-like RNase H domain-containing protein n=1 Tax=Cyphomyrmex costatus TaxID=456900 RepID=A0A151INT6_9HYME|nr:hypothetical protein ALC62_01895 [Cyphomyrmex costatus]
MKLSKTLYFNRKNLKVEDFVNLGQYTSEEQKKGKWIQCLACFLSVGNTSASILHKIIMECIILTEQSGLKVDTIISDGASWNRSMWNIFGVKEECVSIQHIVTPEGVVSLKHWYAILAIEKPHGFNLKSSYHLDEYHIKPKYYQKMNVAMAFRVCTPTMQIFKDTNVYHDLNDADGSIKLCKRVNALITAMNSRTPTNIFQNIENFIIFLVKWGKKAKKMNYSFITEQTCYGLKISLKATLEICSFLIYKCGFEYLMTSRLNQDNLEENLNGANYLTFLQHDLPNLLRRVDNDVLR